MWYIQGILKVGCSNTKNCLERQDEGARGTLDLNQELVSQVNGVKVVGGVAVSRLLPGLG